MSKYPHDDDCLCDSVTMSGLKKQITLTCNGCNSSWSKSVEEIIQIETSALRARIAELENPDMTKLLPVRTAAKNRHPLDGADAQCMEHAITITERERDAALKRIAELEAAQVKSTKMLQRARKDILETARTNQMRLTGVDFVTGDTGCPKIEVHQRGIDDSLLLCGEINDLIRDLPPLPEEDA